MSKNNETLVAGAPRKLFGGSSEAVRDALNQFEEVACPLCHVRPVGFAVDYQGFQLCRCPKCSLQFLSPRPTVEQLNENVYNETYFSESESAGELSAAERHQFCRQLENFERLLGRRGTILDVGCGDGSFLGFALAKGWEVSGTDIRLAAGARAMSCPLWEGQLREIDFGNEGFDVVRFNQVLEHTQNPLLELKRSCELLNTGGIVFVSVPNIAGLSPRLKSVQSRFHLKRKRWRHYAALHHLWFFSPDTLKKLVERAGLRTVYWETPILKKSGQSSFLEHLYRKLLETSRTASILDFYCQKTEEFQV
ncbi:MAG TPA: class I SAM-dependent methyltransferase [Pyrinomonadaceae bacterium]|nr:class I SAM-dependent methyltransferase [Pyrinomonadaceae bacterium]